MNNESNEEKIEQKYCSQIVKDVHASLRRSYAKYKDMDTIWMDHCRDHRTLQEYASAMHHLAVDHWAVSRTETRIEWCRDSALEYFLHGGLKKVFQKKARCIQYLHRTSGSSANGDPNIPERNNLAELTIVASPDDTRVDPLPIDVNVISRIDLLTQGTYSRITIPFLGKIRLLDVGSCYNPFLSFGEFLSVGIDISPAKESVYKCDFLHLETTEPLQVATDTFETYISNLPNPIEKLPRQSFHVIVFSLLLEYFPCSYPRWVCCQRAHELLQEHGLLLIITPDSNHQNKNSPMMKSWKRAIESIGYVRWKYEKQEHLHCIAFRKVRKQTDLLVSDITTDMLYIPQDLNQTLEKPVTFMPPVSNETDDFFSKTVCELPGDIHE